MNHERLSRLYKQHASYMAKVALRVLGRSDDAHDVVHDVFAIGADGRFDDVPDGAMRTWLRVVTVRFSQDRARRRNFLRPHPLDESKVSERLVDGGASAAAHVDVVRIYRALEACRPAERRAWIHRYVEGQKLAEVAAACGCSLATAKRRIATAHAEVERAMRGDEAAGAPAPSAAVPPGCQTSVSPRR